MSSSEALPSCPAVAIEPMLDRDLDQVVAIEQGSSPAPWPARLFLEDLARDWAHIDIARPAPADIARAPHAAVDECADVAPAVDPTTSESVLGFANYWLVQDELHLLNLATHPDHRRRGVGTKLLKHLIDVADDNSCHVITLEVRRSNEPAQALYRSHSFTEVGVRSRYYANGEDALVMTLDMPVRAIRMETQL